MTTRPETIASFARRVFPPNLEQSARQGFLALAQERTLEPEGSRQLDASNGSLVFVGSGALKLVAHASEHREQVIAFYFPDDFFILPENGAHSFSLHGLRRTEMLIFPHKPFAALARNNCEMLRYLLDRTALSLQRSREKTIALGCKTALERTAGFFLGMADRIGRPRGAQVDLDLPMSRRDIADSLGLTIETVSRQISCLRAARLIETHGRSGITILSCDALERRSGSLRHAACGIRSGFDLDQCDLAAAH